MNTLSLPDGCPWWSEVAMRHGLRQHGTVPALAECWDVHHETLYKWADRHGINLEDP